MLHGTALGGGSRAVAGVPLSGRAGTMGIGIALALADTGLAVTLAEQQQDALQAALQRIRNHYVAAVARGKLSSGNRHARLGRIHGTVVPDDLRSCDQVIEAVFEDLSLKRKV